MHIEGMLKGLQHTYAQPLQYFVRVGNEQYELNSFLGNHIELQFAGKIECVFCGKSIKKTFNNGSCYPCFKNRAENDLCIVKPHLCHYDQGTCRDEAFGQRNCMIPHYVYLAVSSGVKVGITRKRNELKRWGDQGAVYALPIAEVPDRKTAGDLEIILSEHVADKTNWRNMLKGHIDHANLEEVRQDLIEIIPESFHPFLLTEEELVEYSYPILEEIAKIKSYNLDKNPIFQDRLIGIKGQYLIFEAGVINMRKYAGYYISIHLV